jgi:DNA primase
VRYPPHILEEIRARLPASSVVGRRVQLKKAGREWRGLSPFNAEKTPSFYVNDQKQFYHCFSSSKHGDIFTFLMETEGLSFPEAVERLAGEAGVSLPAPTEDTRAAETKRAGAIEVMEMAARWFEERLQSGQGSEARAYLERRALGREIQEKFRLGYAPNERYALRDHLARQGVDKALMIEMGLLAAGENVSVPYDYFRDRVMFPITDTRGRVVAFGGRALAKDVRAKYLNSPETPLFHKGRTLYNLHGARKAAHERGSIIAVEGYVDVIAMTLAGHPETVAPLGTALTEDQLGLLWRHADEPILCFDGDKAGQRAAFRALDLALPLVTAEKSVRFAAFPAGQDPDDLYRSGGADRIHEIVQNAISFFDVLIAKALFSNARETPEQKARFAQDVRADIEKINDRDLKFSYHQELRERLKALNSSPTAAGWKGQPRDRRQSQPSRTFIREKPSVSVTASVGFTGAASIREALIVGTLLVQPEMLADFAEEIAELDFEDPDAKALLSVLLACAAEDERTDPDVLQNRITRAGLSAAAERILALARSRDRNTVAPHADPAQRADALRQAMILHRQAGALHSELREARQAFENDPTDAGWAWLCEVKARLDTVIAAEAEADLPVSSDSTAA